MSGGIYTDPVTGAQSQRSQALDRENAALIASLRAAWRDDFNGAALDPQAWVIVQNDPGQTISLAGGELTIAAGTMADEVTIIRSLIPLSIPVRAWFIGRLSQRIANQEIWLEVVNAAGDMAAAWQLSGTSAASGKYLALNGGNGALSAASTIASTASDTILEIELFPDEAWFANRAVDSTVSKANAYCVTRNVPDPADTYFVQIRVANLSTAPASNTNFILGAVCVQDINELVAEITGGRGDTAGAKAVSVAGVVQISPQTGSGYTSHHHLISAAGVNATSVITSTNNIGALILGNTSASWRYFKLFAKNSAPVVGTDVPALTIPLPPNATTIFHPAAGLRLTSGIAYAITAGAADNDATGIGAGEVIVNLSRV